MFNQIIKYIVYFLSFLIFIAVFALIYGVYIKISPLSKKEYKLEEVVSLSLPKNQKITNMQVIDNNRILVTIEHKNEIQAIIFNIDSQKIIQRIIR